MGNPLKSYRIHRIYMYETEPIDRLININGAVTKFYAEFTLTSIDMEPFKMIITNNTILNLNKPLDYRWVTDGVISGRIELGEANDHEEWFICLRSDKSSTMVTVEINLQPNYSFIEYNMKNHV